MEGLREKGLEPVVRQWKRRLTDILSEEARRMGRAPLTLLDYTDPSDPRNREAVPEPFTEHMTYWNDAYHYSIHYGDEMVRDIFQEDRRR
jgi:hypothetical protein